jgi:hypothetical protein
MEDAPESEHTQANEVVELLDVAQLNIDDSAGEVKKAAYWFYIVAALSVVDLFIQEQEIFIAGLALPVFLHEFLASRVSDIISLYVVPVAFVGTFIFLGYFASRCRQWAFIVGALIYTIDGVFCTLISQWPAFAFHLLIMIKVFLGIRSLGRYEAARKKITS